MLVDGTLVHHFGLLELVGMIYLHFEDILLLKLAFFTQVGILPFLTLEIRIHPAEQLVNGVSKFDDLDYFAAIVGVLHFAFFILSFRLFYGASLNLAI